MALSFANKTSGSASSATDPTTASITPTANALVLVSLNLYKVGGLPSAPASVTGNGITYALVANAGDQDATADGNKQYLYRGMAASPSAGVITISGTWDFIGWTVDEVTGVKTGSNGANAVVQSATNFNSGDNTSGSVTLAAFASTSNGAYGTINASSSPCTPGTGWNEIVDNSSSGKHQTQYRTDNDTVCDWTFATTNYGAVAIEVAVPVVPASLLLLGSGA